ncbi:MAG: hypothetical protein KKH98_09105, partial [Spirochaetes bacterium]|nr:hypothetical protein [Spirochaetota bacterium]
GKSIDEIKAIIMEDGIIDAPEVASLEAVLFDDGVIDIDEMKMMVDLADESDAEKNDPSFGVLFNKCVRSRYLEDETSPGAIDASEGAEIKELFYGDGNLNSYEKGALAMIKEEATDIAGELQDILTLVLG